MKNKSTLHIFVGISGSGKSTQARAMQKEYPRDSIILSRDSIRMALFGYTPENLHEHYLDPKLQGLENMVTDHIDELIKYNSHRRMKIILDSTHLKMNYIEQYAKYGLETFLHFPSTTLEESLIRDENRVKKVGEAVIKSQFKKLTTLKDELFKGESFNNVVVNINEDQWVVEYTFRKKLFFYKPRVNLVDAIVVDIDGTIADNMGKRSPFDMKLVGQDEPKWDVLDVVDALRAKGYPIIICTGRDGSGMEETLKWLETHNIKCDHFYIRREGDMRPDYVVKQEMWMDIIQDYNILVMIDDRRQVVDHARSLGFTVMDVANHTF